MITDKNIRAKLEYNPETGVITWAGSKRAVGHNDGRGYLISNIFGRWLKVHRIAWFLHYGAWPKQTIDHINRIKDDNRISNLRDVSHFVNTQNRSDNKSGVVGVYWDATKEKWRAKIRKDGKMIGLGYFDDIDVAAKVRRDAEVLYHPE